MLCLITNRQMSREPLARRVDTLLECGIPYVILRERDLPESQLMAMARFIKMRCDKYGARLIVNSNVKVAAEAGAYGVELPFPLFLMQRDQLDLDRLSVGVWVHSLEEALAAEEKGAHRLLAGYRYNHDNRKGMMGQGLSFLSEITGRVHIPVWAVGGILPDNIGEVMSTGAEAACIMEPFLSSDAPALLVQEYQEALDKMEAARVSKAQ